MLLGLVLTSSPGVLAEQAAWTTDPLVDVSSLEITLSLGCTGNSICFLLNGYSSTQDPLVHGAWTGTLEEGGQLEIRLDQQLKTPPTEAWLLEVEPVEFGATAVGTPKITAATIFGVSGGPFPIPGLVFGPHGPTLIVDLLTVGAVVDYAFEDINGDTIELLNDVFEPVEGLMSTTFEMIDARHFEIRNLSIGFGGERTVALSSLFAEEPGELTVTTVGRALVNMSGDLLIRLSLGDDELSWTPMSTSSGYDVVRGDLATLRELGGNFTLATEGCVADDHLEGTTLAYVEIPEPGAGHWFLVRAGAAGTYDTATDAQVAPRDDGINASPAACP